MNSNSILNNLKQKHKIDIIASIRYENIMKLRYANRKIDNHERIENLDKFPFSAIGCLLVKFKSKFWLGSGSLIGPNLVLTAAHNLYVNKEFNSEDCYFFTGLNNDEYRASSKIKKVFMTETYKSGVNESEDYALLVLDIPLGNYFGFFQLKEIDYKGIKEKRFNCYGYPGDKIKKNIPHYEMWGTKLNQVLLRNQYLEYIFDSYSGLSGSSIWYEENDKAYIIGVHVMHDSFSRKGYAVPIRKEIVVQINNWENEL